MTDFIETLLNIRQKHECAIITHKPEKDELVMYISEINNF